MKDLHAILKSNSFRTSLIYYSGTFLLSVANYLYHLLLIRLLVPAEYGEFLTLISFLYIIAIPSGAISTVVTKYVSELFGKEDHTSINQFFYFTLSKIFVPSVFIAVTIMLFSNQLSTLLKAHPASFVVLAISLLSSFMGSVLRSYLISFHLFNFSILTSFLEIVFRAVVTVLLIGMGLGATGAIIGMFLSGIATNIITLFRIRNAVCPREHGRFKPHISPSKLIFVSLIYSAGTLSLLSSDVLVVRIVFDVHTSGLYSGLSMIGRIIYFGLTPLAGILLPIVASRHSAKKQTKRVFHLLLMPTVILGAIGLSLFGSAPQLIISKMAGEEYVQMASLLPSFALTMYLFSINYLLITYCFAVSRHLPTAGLLFVALLQPILISLFHSSLSSVVGINLILQLVLLVCNSFYYKIILR